MQKPSRRNLLSTVAASGSLGVSGCLQAWSTSSSQPTAEINRSELPQELNSHFQLDVSLKSQFSKEHPARIRISFRHSKSASASRTVKFGEVPPFSFYNGGKKGELGELFIAIPDTTEGLEASGDAAVESNRWVPDSPENGCWRVPAVPRVDRETQNTIELAPGDSVSEEYRLLGYGQDNCLSPGNYLFRSHEPFKVSQDDEIEWQNPYGGNWAIQFTLQLSNS